MFENSNRELVKELADETMKSHRLRNIMACFAIGLTAILITIVCGAGITITQAILTEQSMNPGPGTNGAGVCGGLDALDKVAAQPEVEWADIARPCMQGTPHNKELAGNEVHFLGVSDGYYAHHYVDLINGKYPENAQEVLMSDTLAKKIGKDTTPGQKITLNLVVLKNGVSVEEPVELTISGFYDNPLRAIENYEELYTTEDFPDLYNPELGDSNSKIFTKLSGVTNSTPTAELQEKLTALNEAVSGESICYIMATDFTMMYVGGTALLLLIIACGYFLIYNIFYISIVNDIRFIGNMRTIGMTGRQIRSMLGYQVRRLGLAGTIAGICIGTGMNIVVVNLLQTMEYSFSRYCELNSALIPAALGAAVFSAITVWISSRKAVSLASKVSPVEASRFRLSGKKKTVFAVISFALSGILFSVLYTVMLGYDVEYMVNRMHETDFNVLQHHAGQLSDAPYEPMDQQLISALKNLPFVSESYTFYRARNLNETSDEGQYSESSGTLKYEGLLKDLLNAETQNAGWTTEALFDVENGNCNVPILGMPASALSMEEKQFNIYNGSIDAAEFATGDYMIYQPYSGWGKGADYQFDYLKAGDQLPVSFYNYETQSYVTKTFTIMAVVGGKPDNYAGQLSSMVQMIIPDHTLQEIYGTSADQMVSSVLLNTSGGNEKEQLETLKKMIAESFNPQVQIKSKCTTRQNELIKKQQQTLLGLFVGLVFGLIGMTNIVNTLVTGVLSRKIEFAALQSIGMTKKQMAGTIFWDGMKMVLISTIVLLPISAATAYAVASPPLSTGFALGAYIQSVLLVLAAGILLTVLTAVILTCVLNKKTVVERLREAS